MQSVLVSTGTFLLVREGTTSVTSLHSKPLAASLVVGMASGEVQSQAVRT